MTNYNADELRSLASLLDGFDAGFVPEGGIRRRAIRSKGQTLLVGSFSTLGPGGGLTGSRVRWCLEVPENPDVKDAP